ncbi:MAG: glycosyltransferase family 2 protein [Treponema sp.]|nr:glycosyltransferase family 2 protein [Treponema sp.]
MTNPLISVIIPTYNREKTILRSVMSVLNQTYKNLELIVVDDCSTDNTKEVVSQIKDSRFKYYCLERNSGACVARNYGIEKAAGEYIAFNDSDDQWHKDKLEKQLSFLINNNVDVTVCSMDVYDEGSSEKMYTFPDSKKSPEGAVSFDSLLKYNCTSTQMLFGKIECFKENLFDSNMPRFQDWEECLRLSKKYKFFHQNEILVDTYQQKDSITKNPQKGVAGMKLLFEKHKDAILSAADITESFFKKMSTFTCRCGKNPVMEMTYIYKAHKSFSNLLKLIMARIGLYRFFFNFKNS